MGSCPFSPSCQAIPLTIANASFEAPVFADAGFSTAIPAAQQGGYGWSFSGSAAIFNPPAIDYANAGGNGAPAGADGPQAGSIAGTLGDFDLYQRLAGVDGMVGNGDDPELEPFTIYTLTVAVGQRAVGNLYGGTAGGYDIQLRAGPNVFTANILAGETDAVPLQLGSFIERTIVWDSALANPDDLAQPLTILFGLTKAGSLAATEFDNVRLDAVYVPPTADFDKNGIVDGADLETWNAGFGMSGAVTPMQGDVDRNLRIDGADFLYLQRERGTAAAAPASIPEPSTGCLIVGALAALRAGLRGKRNWSRRSAEAPYGHAG
jgi:hypothetical protein